MKNILMVCLGNICRSPMAEGLLKHYSAQEQLGLNVSSAGLQAVVGFKANAFSLEIMQKHGVDISAHRARQMTQEMLLEADLILVMETWQQKELGYIFPSAYGKVHSLGRWGNFEIPDPYRMPLANFQETYSLIEQGMREWKQKIWS